MMHNYSDLISIFEATFFERFNTKLVKGDDEPVYLPADENTPYNQIIFAHGFFASALHEIAHWCVAGTARHHLVDFGYWYNPDGRDAEQQAEFERVEIKPQAIEWILSVAAGFNFKVSCDNLNGSCEPNRAEFRTKIYQQVNDNLTHGLSERVEQLCAALTDFYHQPYPLKISQFNNVET